MEKTIKRAKDTKIKREKEPVNFREEDEVRAALKMGAKPHVDKHLFRDVYEMYQNNEY